MDQLEHNQYAKQELPNATAILVLGIISIIGCICYGIVGLVCGILALIFAANAKKIVDANPDLYSSASIGNMKAGKICAIIGVSLSACYVLIMIVYLVFMGSILAGMPWQNFK